MSRQLRVAIVGAGPAGVYAADILTKNEDLDVLVDVLDRDPTPFGLIRYGVAPDHPRIKEIIKALKRVMSNERIRFYGNVNVGADIKLEELRDFYDAIIFATGARRDRELNIPGVDLHGSYGAADFVYWYDGHPDVSRDWDFQPHAKEVAVLGVGNVGLDIARILAKTAEELLVTEIPDNVYEGLKKNATTDVHVFARRGPAQVKFTPMELRELSHSPNIDVVIHPEGFEFDAGSMEALQKAKSQKLVVDVLQNYLAKEPSGAPHRIHVHFCQNPVEILGEDGKVVGLRTEITELDGTGNVRGTGEFKDWPIQAVYRAIGYYSDPITGLPFDASAGVVPNDGGHVIDLDGSKVPGVYVTGWIKRGPVGLIGHTKSDAAQTVAMLVEDIDTLAPAKHPDVADFEKHLESQGIEFTNWAGWETLDAHEIELGTKHEHERERVKVVDRQEMVDISRNSK